MKAAILLSLPPSLDWLVNILMLLGIIVPLTLVLLVWKFLSVRCPRCNRSHALKKTGHSVFTLCRRQAEQMVFAPNEDAIQSRHRRSDHGLFHVVFCE